MLPPIGYKHDAQASLPRRTRLRVDKPLECRRTSITVDEPGRQALLMELAETDFRLFATTKHGVGSPIPFSSVAKLDAKVTSDAWIRY